MQVLTLARGRGIERLCRDGRQHGPEPRLAGAARMVNVSPAEGVVQEVDKHPDAVASVSGGIGCGQAIRIECQEIQGRSMRPWGQVDRTPNLLVRWAVRWAVLSLGSHSSTGRTQP